MDFMTTSPTYTLGDHLKLLELIADKSGANGWRKMLLTDAQKSSLEEQLVDLKLIDILTPAEKNDVRLLDGAARARLATQLGVTVQRVNQFLDGFKQSVNVHKWLATRKSQGKALPQTMEEYVNCMMGEWWLLAACRRPGQVVMMLPLDTVAIVRTPLILTPSPVVQLQPTVLE